MKYNLIIFDMDGTILNTIEDIADSANFICQKYGYPVHTYDEVKYFVGNGLPKMIERALPKDISKDEYQKILDEFIPYYKDHSAIKTHPYDGIVECIKAFKKQGLVIAVNTNKIESAAVELCNKYFTGCFDIISGSRPGVPPKPAPDGIFEILEKAKDFIKDQKINACYVGDSDVDLQTSINSKLDFIGAHWGFRGRDFLLEHGAKVIAQDAVELEKIILE